MYGVLPVIVLSEGFEEGIVGENVWAFEIVVEYERQMARVGQVGPRADELDGYEVWVDGGDWVSDDLGLDLVEVAQCKLGGAS
ncbi:hypothetical protein M0R45_015489 [Rubus argutus]|uniref:MHC class II antigen n=1 Tax=Rubus argutus TaxID=59490 RepID=A0AAW1XPV1_RUBAR